jgi:hypothetical protein
MKNNMRFNLNVFLIILTITTISCVAKLPTPAIAVSDVSIVDNPKIITMNNVEYEVVGDGLTEEFRMIPVKKVKLKPIVVTESLSTFPRSSKFEEVCPDPSGCVYKDGKCIGCIIEEVPGPDEPPQLIVKDNENVYINTSPTVEPVVTKVEKPKEKFSLEGRYRRVSDEVVLWDGTPITKSTVSGKGIIYEIKKLGFDMTTRLPKYEVTIYGMGTVKYDDPEFPNFQSNTQCDNDPTVYIIVLNESGKLLRKTYINSGWCESMHYNKEFWKTTDYGIVREREGRMSNCCHAINTELTDGPIQMTISYHLEKI